ncbi:hypothetical protein D4R52_03505 [bacterium]|nr:MAG: hypothetical protein D4R52_03505 [bacterium]
MRLRPGIPIEKSHLVSGWFFDWRIVDTDDNGQAPDYSSAPAPAGNPSTTPDSPVILNGSEGSQDPTQDSSSPAANQNDSGAGETATAEVIPTPTP